MTHMEDALEQDKILLLELDGTNTEVDILIESDRDEA